MEAIIAGGLWFVRCSYSRVNYVYLSISGDGGAYPECHVAQYPLGLGKKKVCQ